MNLSRRGFLRSLFVVAGCLALGQKKLLVEPPAQQTFQWVSAPLRVCDQKFAPGFYFARFEYFPKPTLAGGARSMTHDDPCSVPAVSIMYRPAGEQRGLEAWRPV